jgi:NADH-quinone oxidoreductase subunit N
VTIDHVALLPAYAAAGTAVLAFLAEIVAPGRRGAVLTVTILGTLATGLAAGWAFRDGSRVTFCIDAVGCSYAWDGTATLVGMLFVVATLVVAALSVPVLRSGTVPAGEYCFLLACSLTGGVVLGASRDLITLIIALETLTLPLFVLVGLRRRHTEAAEAAVTFFVVSVVSTAVTLLGAALLYGAAGTVHLDTLAVALGERTELVSVPLVGAAAVLVLVGLAFKVAAVPFHAWAPATYDGAPLPVAAYLSTASKLGGVIALLLVAVSGLGGWLDVSGPAFAVMAVLTMTVGNLVALRQRRMVRLLAWSSVAQAGYILAPLGAFVTAEGRSDVRLAVSAVLAYTVFYVLLELGAFGAVVALRGAADGGHLDDYRGTARRHPWLTGAFVLALAGLAGLPPGLAGLFAKVAVVRSLLGGAAGWLALVVAVNAVIGLAYYVRAALALFAREEPAPVASDGRRASPSRRGIDRVRVPIAVGAALAAVTIAALVAGFAPQLVLDAVQL